MEIKSCFEKSVGVLAVVVEWSVIHVAQHAHPSR